MTIKQHIHALACRAYAAVELFGYAYLVYPNSLLVRVLDKTVGSKCKYCMAVRALIVGFGLGFGGWLGVALVAVAVGLTVIENGCKDE